MNYIKGTRDLVSTRKKTFIENLQSLRANQHSDDQKPSNNIDAKQDRRQKEFGKQPFNTRMDKVIDNFIFILLVKYTLQSLKGQKNKKKEKRKRGSKEAQFLPTSSSRFRPLLWIALSF